MDKQIKNEELPNLLVYIDLFEKSIKDLSTLFEEHSAFWVKFNALKNEYKSYVLTEKINNKKQDFFEQYKFEELAHGKSIMCQAVISALEILDSNSTHSQALQEIIKNIHIAFQYRDDIDDFNRDVQNEQWTYAQFRVSQFLQNESITLETKYLKNALFVSGLAEEFLTRANSVYQIACDISKDLGLSILNDFLHKEIQGCKNQIDEINIIIQKSQSILEKSNTPLFGISQKANKSVINKSASKAFEFLTTNRNEQGYWTDFATSAGHSTMWVTGFVVSNLSEAGFIKSFNTSKTLAYIQKNKFQTGYSETTLSDCDTAAFSIAAHKSFELNIEREVLNDWFSYQKENGGWTTYKPSIELVNFIGAESSDSITAWTNPQKCVSSYAFYLLAKYNFDKTRLLRTHNYLKTDINKNGFVSSYWWTSPIYATTYTLLGLKEMGFSETKDFKKLETYIHSSQISNGSWIDDFGVESSFYTSLALLSLLKTNPKKHKKAIEQGINWLLANQFNDGSFKVEHILRIPASNIGENDFDKINWKRGSLGLNVLVDDHNRLFTSSIALNTIKNFGKCL
jgi:hypothetical protein